MTEKFENLEFLRDILKKVKSNLMMEEELSDIELFDDFLQAMATIGKEEISELKQEIFDLLDVGDEMVRDEAVKTLGYNTRLGLPEFRDKAYEIWLNDPSEDVRTTAISAWIDSKVDSKDKNAIVILYEIFKNDSYNYLIRKRAYKGILTTIDYRNIYQKYIEYGAPCPTNIQEFNDFVNWKVLNKLMLEYAPEVLGESDKRSIKTGYYEIFKGYLTKISALPVFVLLTKGKKVL